MEKWFWIISFSVLWLSATPILAQTPEDFQGSDSRQNSKISAPDKPEPRSKSTGATVAGRPLALIGNIDAVRAQVASDEKDLPKDRDARLGRLIDLSRLYFVLGEEGVQEDNKLERRKYYAKGRHYAKLLKREYPQRVEGHYWFALNRLGLAGIGQAGPALISLPFIVKELEIARDLDEAYDQAGPDRVLGRLYFKAPPWPMSVGNLTKSLEMLRAAVTIAPENSTNHLFLAETFLQMDRKDEAFVELKKVLCSTRHSVRPQCLEDDRQQAIELIKKFKKDIETGLEITVTNEEKRS